MLVTKAKNDWRTPQRISLFDVTSSQAPSTRSCGCKRGTLTSHKKSRFQANREIFAAFYSEKYGDFVRLIKFFGVIGTLILTTSQVHKYGTRAASSYRSHYFPIQY